MDETSNPTTDVGPFAAPRGELWRDVVSGGFAVTALMFILPLPLLGLHLAAVALALTRSRTWVVPAGITAITLSAVSLTCLHVLAFGLDPVTVWP